MKAVLLTQYGSPEVLQLMETSIPVPREREVLVKIVASTVTMGDCELRGLFLPQWTRIPMRIYMGYGKPKNFTPGMEFSGVVEAVGSKVTSFSKGDEVFGSDGARMGANAEYKIQRNVNILIRKPSEISHEEAATIPVGGLNALHFLRKANIQPGQKVLIIGAGGSIGTYGVQLAKLYGAQVTAIDSTGKLDILRAIGADQVIDYTKEDFSENGEKYDVIFDIVYNSSFAKCLRSLMSSGYYLMANPDPIRMLRALWVSKTTGKKVIFTFAGENAEDFRHLADLMAAGKIKAVIDRTYPLYKIAEAHDYVEKGLKKGNLVISMVNDNKTS